MHDGARRSSARRVLLPILVVAGSGVAAGALAKVADGATVSWIGDLGTRNAVWVAALAVLARLAPSPWAAAVHSAVFFLAMCAAYYAWSSLVLGFAGTSKFLAMWGALAVLVVPAVAAGLNVAFARAGALHGGVVAAVAAVPLADGSLWQVWWARGLRGAPENFVLRPVQALVDALVAIAVVAVLPRATRTRLWGAVFVLPCACAVRLVLADVVSRVLPM